VEHGEAGGVVAWERDQPVGTAHAVTSAVVADEAPAGKGGDGREGRWTQGRKRKSPTPFQAWGFCACDERWLAGEH
jgi:hypothetical protein